MRHIGRPISINGKNGVTFAVALRIYCIACFLSTNLVIFLDIENDQLSSLKRAIKGK